MLSGFIFYLRSLKIYENEFASQGDGRNESRNES